jgi:hypothetical protein
MVSALYARLYWTLLASFCVMGLLLAFAQPLFSVPDEASHWRTANFRLEHMFGAEECVPTLFGARCPRYGGPCGAIPKRTMHCRTDSEIYGGVLTYPGVLLSKLILPRQSESAVRQAQAIMLGRLLQGLLVLLCLVRAGSVALQAQRRGALMLGAFALSPLVAQQVFAISADSSQIAFGACMFVAIVAWDRLRWLDFALYAFFGFSSTAKPTLLPCILPGLMAAFWFAALLRDPAPSVWEVAKQLAQSLRPRTAPSVQTCMLWCGIALTLLTIIFSLHLDASYQEQEPVSPSRIANASALRENPWLIWKLIGRQSYLPWAPASWVSPLGWLDAPMAPVVLKSFWRLLILMALIEVGWLGRQLYRERPSGRLLLARFGRALMPLSLGLLGPAVNVAFVCAVMFVLETPAGGDAPHGVQFRYYFPAVMVCLALLGRALDALALDAGAEPTETQMPSQRWSTALTIALPLLVLSLTLPYVSRVYVDIAQRYHDGARSRY